MTCDGMYYVVSGYDDVQFIFIPGLTLNTYLVFSHGVSPSVEKHLQAWQMASFCCETDCGLETAHIGGVDVDDLGLDHQLQIGLIALLCVLAKRFLELESRFGVSLQ